MIGTAKETKVVECGQSRYDYKMKKIDGCSSTTIGTEWSRTKKKIPTDSESLCRDSNKKILAPMRHKDEYYRSLLTVYGWCNVWDDGTPRQIPKKTEYL